METPEILFPALRQYCHNTGKGLLAGFDHDETVKIIESLQAENKKKEDLQIELLKRIESIRQVYVENNKLLEKRNEKIQSLQKQNKKLVEWVEETAKKQWLFFREYMAEVDEKDMPFKEWLKKDLALDELLKEGE